MHVHALEKFLWHFFLLALIDSTWSQVFYSSVLLPWGALSKKPNRAGASPHLRTETDPISETSCFYLLIL
jgi:hypothetical protein